MFKEKSSKKKYISDNNEVFTLDAMHNNIIKKFELTNKDKENCKVLLSDFELLDGFTEVVFVIFATSLEVSVALSSFVTY